MKHTAKLIAIPIPDDAPASASTAGSSFVVECTNAEHPTLTGRVEVRWGAGDCQHARWLPALRGLAIRTGDRLLVATPANWDEPIVVGVIDGFARRPAPSREHKATLDLLPDESVCIRSASGAPLLELATGERGAEIRLLEPDLALEIDGHLAIGAKQITLRAREGEARIEACDDVVVRGENIHLN
jgi:hypothetical protein